MVTDKFEDLTFKIDPKNQPKYLVERLSGGEIADCKDFICKKKAVYLGGLYNATKGMNQ